MINIAQLLKKVPKEFNLTLWSPLFGPVKFLSVDSADSTIIVETERGTHEWFSVHGKYKVMKSHMLYSDAECLLFPAKGQTWEGWKLPVIPKFKVGDWLWHNTLGVHPILVKDYSEQQGYKVEGLGLTYYIQQGVVDNEYRLWTIQDAKDGDVLATDNIICIFRKLDKDGYYIISPCVYTVKDGLEIISDENDTIGSYGFKPASKEDRELLFRKMKEEGYQWDEEKKELMKIPKHYNINNFHAGMEVLVRDANDKEWRYVLYSHYTERFGLMRFNAGATVWVQCIPFEGNEHLLGTTDPCDKQYINW